MKNGEYESVEQIDTDLNLMFENAKRYNMPNSSIYKRAFRLQQIMQVSTTTFTVVRGIISWIRNEVKRFQQSSFTC